MDQMRPDKQSQDLATEPRTGCTVLYRCTVLHGTSQYSTVHCPRSKVRHSAAYIHNVLPSWAPLPARPRVGARVSRGSGSRARPRSVAPCVPGAPASASAAEDRCSTPFSPWRDLEPYVNKNTLILFTRTKLFTSFHRGWT
jgi:hypothetical protein